MSGTPEVVLEKEILMVQIDVSMTLAEAVDAHPAMAREFERLGLDYCCGGQRTLAEACTLIGIDSGATVAELTAAAANGYRHGVGEDVG